MNDTQRMMRREHHRRCGEPTESDIPVGLAAITTFAFLGGLLVVGIILQ